MLILMENLHLTKGLSINKILIGLWELMLTIFSSVCETKYSMIWIKLNLRVINLKYTAQWRRQFEISNLNMGVINSTDIFTI